jgi:membrane protease YdiL (CAAX protease family)
LWGLAISLPCLLVAGILVTLTRYGHAPESAAFEKLPLWLMTLVVLRAGVVEEFLYRGYAITRLEGLGVGRSWSVAIPLVIFSVAPHWTGGWADIVIALALGSILSGF